MKNNRTNKILEILSTQEKADVVSLAEICHVSQVTRSWSCEKNAWIRNDQ